MSITRDPIFKSVMFALAVIYIALISQSVWAAKPGEEPAGSQDVQFVGFTDATFDGGQGVISCTTYEADANVLLPPACGHAPYICLG